MQFGKRLFDAIRQEKVVLFIGAGFSLKAGMPSCSTIIKAVAQQIHAELKDDYTIDELEHQSMQDLTQIFVEEIDNGRNKLLQILEKLFSIKPTDLTDHTQLKSIPHFRRIYTTNYDSLLEVVYGEECVVIRGNNDVHLFAEENKVQIIKLHGDFSKPNNIIITRKDYDAWFKRPNEDLIWQQLNLDFATHHILFIGYSLADTNLTDAMSYVDKAVQPHKKQHYIVAPYFKQAKIKKLKKDGLVHISGKAEDLFAELIPYLEKHIIKDISQNRVRQCTAHKFCANHNVALKITSTPKGNQIEDIQSTNGECHTIDFEIRHLLSTKLSNISNNANSTMNVLGFNLPCIAITKDELCSYSHMLNNIKIMGAEDISTIKIGPAYYKGETTLIVPSARLSIRFPYVSYPNSKHSITHILSGDGITINITLTYYENSSKLTINFTVEYQETFSNLTYITNLTKAFIDIWSAQNFRCDNIFPESGFTRLPKSKLSNTDFAEYIEYFENLRDIEFITGESFNLYQRHSKQNLKFSRIIKAFVEKSAITTNIHKGSTVEFDITLDTGSPECDLEIGQTYTFRIIKHIDNPIILCDKAFKINYQHNVFKNSLVLEKFHIDDNTLHLKLKITDNFYLSYFSVERHPQHKEKLELVCISITP